MSPDEWRDSGDWISFNGIRIFVREAGYGPPLIALHAFPTSSFDYSRMAPLLAGRFRLILFDYPGYGFSDKPRPHPYSLVEAAGCLAAVAGHFGIRRAFLLAHDIGTSIALISLSHRLLAVDRLVLMNGSLVSIPFTDPVMRLAQRLLLHPSIGPLIGRAGLINKSFFAATARQLFSYSLPPAELADFWSVITYNDGAPLYPILMRYMWERWGNQHTWLAALAAHPAPLTLIWGQLDPIATPTVAGIVHTRRPDAALHRLDHAGHYPHWEAPGLVADLLTAALT